MAYYSTPNARDLAELDLLNAHQRLQLLERKIKTVSIENAELSSLGKGKSAYELKGKVHFLVDSEDFKKRKRALLHAIILFQNVQLYLEELSELKLEKEVITAQIQDEQKKLGQK